MPLTPRHVVPIENPGPHTASTLCRCGPIASFTDLATGAPVYRHRRPAPPLRVEPKPRGEDEPIPTALEQLPEPLRDALLAVRGGASSPVALAHRIHVHESIARAMWRRLVDLGLIDGPGGAAPDLRRPEPHTRAIAPHTPTTTRSATDD